VTGWLLATLLRDKTKSTIRIKPIVTMVSKELDLPIAIRHLRAGSSGPQFGQLLSVVAVRRVPHFLHFITSYSRGIIDKF